ncbi:MAG: hypothetical protein K6A71_02000 [Lachnospiraceae bacterium]|nr:hypothetical protein [Lachnospiraceae bacterium]
MAKMKKRLSSDPKLRKKQLRDAALREAAAKKAKETQAPAVGTVSTAASGEVQNNTSGEAVKNNTIMGTADVKKAVKEVIMNNTTDSRIEELISNSSKNLSKRQRKENDADLINAMQSDDMKVLAELLIEMRNKDERKLRYTRFQAWLATFTSLLALIVVCFVGFAVIRILPQINQIVDQANQIIDQANQVIAQASDTIEIANGAIVTANDAIVQANDAIVQVNEMLGDIQPAIDNLNKVAQDLADADINGMLADVDKLVTSSEKNLGDALKTITEIDIKSLNDSIADLNAVVKPLASMFRR